MADTPVNSPAALCEELRTIERAAYREQTAIAEAFAGLAALRQADLLSVGVMGEKDGDRLDAAIRLIDLVSGRLEQLVKTFGHGESASERLTSMIVSQERLARQAA